MLFRSDKWVVAPESAAFTKEYIQETVFFQEQYFQTEIIMEDEKIHKKQE